MHFSFREACEETDFRVSVVNDMLYLRKLRKLFRRDSTAHVHPSTKDEEVITVERMEQILRESYAKSKLLHVKVSQETFVTKIIYRYFYS